MQGLITLDFGNTNPHAGLFQKNADKWDLIKVVPWSELNIYLNQLGMNPHNSQMVLCQVKEREAELLPYLQQGYLLTRVKEYWRGNRFAGMPVNYTNTLGEDRLIEAFYAYKQNQTPTLIIDAGTFVTMDVVDQAGFHGGYILPGTQVYYAGFGQGEQLKDVHLSPSFTPGLPHDTASAMNNGYIAFAALAKELIHGNGIQKVVLTGGLTSLWEELFKTLTPSLVVDSEPHLLHWALHYWMTTQIEPL